MRTTISRRRRTTGDIELQPPPLDRAPEVVSLGAASTDRSLTLIFTPEATVLPGVPDRAQAVVAAAGSRIHGVRLLVGDVEQEWRTGAESRRELHKLTDLGIARHLRNDRQDHLS
jgi:hypothetical protein